MLMDVLDKFLGEIVGSFYRLQVSLQAQFNSSILLFSIQNAQNLIILINIIIIYIQ
jgi:hypothetical protein